MDTTPYLWRNQDGSVVTSVVYPDPPHIPEHYSIHHRPATEHDLATLSFLNPNDDTRSDCDRGL